MVRPVRPFEINNKTVISAKEKSRELERLEDCGSKQKVCFNLFILAGNKIGFISISLNITMNNVFQPPLQILTKHKSVAFKDNETKCPLTLTQANQRN